LAFVDSRSNLHILFYPKISNVPIEFNRVHCRFLFTLPFYCLNSIWIPWLINIELLRARRSDIVSNQFRICPRQSLHLIKVKRFDTEFNFENRCFVFLDSKWHSTQDIVLDNAFKTTSPTFVYRHTGVQWTYCQYKDIHPPVECFSSRIKIRQQWNDRKISIQWSVGNRNPKNEISTFGSFLSMRKKPDSGWNSFHYYLPFNPVNLTADESIDAPFNPAPKFTSGNKVFNAKPLINDDWMNKFRYNGVSLFFIIWIIRGIQAKPKPFRLWIKIRKAGNNHFGFGIMDWIDGLSISK
jgi:hypothetical protein